MPGNYAELKAKLRGRLIQRGDAAYDEARKLYNAMIDKKPRLIARCVDAADVIACANYARENDLLLAIRGGGHNGPGLGSCDDGLVIDLSAMRSVRVDPSSGTVQVEGGCVWGDVDHATHAFGLAVPAGIISTTGVGGLTLGGGIGYLSRAFGLTIDNLQAVDLVLADGSFITASEQHHPDLFWAVRGGGGNFGVVTSFQFRAKPLHTVTAGPMFWSLEDSAEIMERYASFIADAPNEINGFFAFHTLPPDAMFPKELHLRKVCGVVWCSVASPEQTQRILQPTQNWPTPLLSAVAPMPYPVLQSLFDSLYPPGYQWYWKADFVDRLSSEAIALHAKFGATMPSRFCTMHLYPINGAVHEKGAEDTAFGYRRSTWAEVIVGVDPDPANKNKITGWAREYWEALHPYAAAGAYVNFMMEEGAVRVEASYGPNYPRLRQIKKRYDPRNLFRVNQNIDPAGVAQADAAVQS